MEDPEDFIDDLILQGAIEPVAYDAEAGEMLYSFTDKLQEIDPRMYQLITNEFHSIIMELWELGILEINFMESNPTVRLTEKAFDEDVISKLTNVQNSVLNEVIRAMSA